MSSYTAPWWCRSPHAQTLWGKLFRARPELPTQRIRWETPDGDFLDIHRLDAPAGSPRAILLHGLEGTVRSHYAGGMLLEAARRGWGADLLIFRSCGGELNRTRRFYHSGETGDLSFAFDKIASEFPDSPIFLAGVSLGGNVLLKWLGENGDRIPSQVAGAAAISVPFDLGRSADNINKGFARVYQAHFLRSLKRKALDKLRLFPDALMQEQLRGAKTIRDFDNFFTAPVHGFRNATDYYEKSSSIRFLGGVTVPTLLLSARDDPFLPSDVLQAVEGIAAESPALSVEFIETGGHAGFVQGRWPWSASYYLERRVADFLDSQLRESGEGQPVALANNRSGTT
jgi:uncharacterized protein